MLTSPVTAAQGTDQQHSDRPWHIEVNNPAGFHPHLTMLVRKNMLCLVVYFVCRAELIIN